jgi:trigger factor
MVERELERRLEDFARRLIDQHIDPRQAGIDWNAFRESQRDVAREAVAAALALDEVTRREQLQVTEEEVEREVGRYAERTGGPRRRCVRRSRKKEASRASRPASGGRSQLTS